MSSDRQPDRAKPAQRTSSFTSLLKRSKSNDLLGERKSSSSRLRKKSLEGDRRSTADNAPPALPTVTPQPVIESFGGENYIPRPSMSTTVTTTTTSTFVRTNTDSSRGGVPPVPPLPSGVQSDSPDPLSSNTQSYMSEPLSAAVQTDHQERPDPYPRTESMTHRSRYSYAQSTASVNSPRRIRRRKDPTPYNILVIGAKNSGKTSFIEFLKTALALPPNKHATRLSETDASLMNKPYYGFTHHYQEIDVDNERVGLTLWDSQGLEKNVVDLQMRELTNFVESKFEETFAEEMKVVRSPGARDTEIHCIFLVLDPSRLDTNMQLAQEASAATTRIGKPPRILGALDEDFELQILKSFQGKTTIVPIISKADTITTAHMSHLKQKVWQSLKQAGLDPLEALNIVADSDDQLDEEDEYNPKLNGNGVVGDDLSPPASPQTDNSDVVSSKIGSVKRRASHRRNLSKNSISSQMMDSGYVPMSIISPDRYSLDPKNGPVGRRFPWGFADPYDPEHCDFVKLKDCVFSEWRNEVREASREIFYERWRTTRLNRQATAKVSNTAAQRKPSGGIPIQLIPSKTRVQKA